MKGITIRKARKPEMGVIERCIREFGLDYENLGWQQFLVAVKGDEVAGFGRIKPYPDFYELGGVGVLEKFRRQGIGSAIVSRLMEDFPSPEIWITTDRREFFARFGFKVVEDGPNALKEKIKRVCQKLQRHNAVIMLFKSPAPRP